jgi:hypothetical protein
MKEPRFFDSQPSVTAQPPPSNPNQSGIQIYWREGAGMIIKIRLHPIKVAAGKNCGIPLKPVFSQRHDMPIALVAENQISFASRPGRRAA